MVKTYETDYQEFVVARKNSDVDWVTEEKAQLVSFGICKRIPITTLCRINNVSPTQYYEWKDIYVNRGTEGLSGKGGSSQRELDLEEKVQTLEHHIGELVLEKELLKKNQKK